MTIFQNYRSLLFTPGDQPRRMEKALTVGADAVCFDLEDGVAQIAKAAARAEIRAMVASLSAGEPPVFVRVNAPATGMMEEDVRATFHPALTGLMLPKAESAEDLRAVAALLDLLDPAGKLELIPLVESARGLRLAYEIAASTPRLSRIAFGAVDYCNDLGLTMTEGGEELLYARSKLVVDSRAAGILPPLDTVWPRIRDLAGFEATALKARQLGMGGKLAVHPDQVAVVNRVFSPSEEELSWARQVVAAYEDMERQGTGVAQVDGQMIERPVYLRALHIAKVEGR